MCTIAAVFLSTAAAAQTFEIASVKPSKSNDPPYSNFPLGPGDVYVPNGGLFSAKNLPLVTYIFFAYKVIGNQGQFLLPQLPDWAKTEQFDIQARAEGNPGKDDMRLLMRALLADRFKLAMHNETREVPVLAFVLSKPGKTRPTSSLTSTRRHARPMLLLSRNRPQLRHPLRRRQWQGAFPRSATASLECHRTHQGTSASAAATLLLNSLRIP